MQVGQIVAMPRNAYAGTRISAGRSLDADDIGAEIGEHVEHPRHEAVERPVSSLIRQVRCDY